MPNPVIDAMFAAEALGYHDGRNGTLRGIDQVCVAIGHDQKVDYPVNIARPYLHGHETGRRSTMVERADGGERHASDLVRMLGRDRVAELAAGALTAPSAVGHCTVAENAARHADLLAAV